MENYFNLRGQKSRTMDRSGFIDLNKNEGELDYILGICTKRVCFYDNKSLKIHKYKKYRVHYQLIITSYKAVCALLIS